MSTFLIVVVVAVVALVLFVASRPATFEIRRSAIINAPPAKIFPLLIDFREWTAWSPWEKLDPALIRTHSGAANGPGAVYEWAGNKKVGKGRMEITSTTPPTKVVIDLHFLAPFEARNVTEFILEPMGTGTNLVWKMVGANSFMGKLMSLFMNMDKMIGKDFESGLANLKSAAER
ncbi:MAG: SRPBCC family protein [Gemmatimonadales bacterium]|nr:SRPBCC family protein [Gemmatimonadales bacterium]